MSDIHSFANLVPYRFRAAHKLWAATARFFWLPCPLCGEEFGGHEWRDIDGLPSSIPDPDEPSLRHGICPACTRAGRGVDQMAQFRICTEHDRPMVPQGEGHWHCPVDGCLYHFYKVS